jgi:hypothetical protein
MPRRLLITWHRLARCQSESLTAQKSEGLERTAKMKVAAQIRGLGRQDRALEQLVVRLSIEGGVSSISWSVTAQVFE